MRRLSDEIDSRVEKGSHILIAIDDDADGAPPPEAEAPPPPPPPEAAAEADPSGATIDGGTYLEPGLPLLGTVDLSVQEMQLPTHAIAEGMYVSHMAIAPSARRQGIARALLAEVVELAKERGEDRLYLHVEPSNAPAVSLYESAGYAKQGDVPPYGAFTRALKLQDRAVLYAKTLS